MGLPPGAEMNIGYMRKRGRDADDTLRSIALPTTAYACPQTCPKQLRNGPCGGVFPDGSCEVYPETRCVWVIAYERAEQTGHVEDLRRLVRPIDHQKWGQSSWINFWAGRDEDLWTEDNGLEHEQHL